MILADQIKELEQRREALERCLGIDQKRIDLRNEEEKTQEPDFWDTPDKAREQLRKVAAIKAWVDDYDVVAKDVEDLGLMPQSINKYGTYGVRAKEDAEAEKLIKDARLLEEAGCFALVLEKIPAALATRVAQELTIPVIGIGAGGGVDGQVLVVTDMLGMTKGFSPRFLRRYADLNTVMTDAIGHYVADVKACDFPNESEQY